MGKWLAVAGLALIAVLVLMWKQLHESSATPVKPVAKTESAAQPSSSGAPVESKPAAVAAAEVEPTEAKPEKIDVESDQFFYKFQEVVPAVLTRNAATCYEGISKKLHRNQKLVLTFKTKIKNGIVTITDVKTEANTLGNAGLEACFIQQIQRSTWHDDELPDWEADDQLVLRPERGMKKYMRDNIEYVGAPAPKD
jgi:hypothetical protein